MKKTSLCTLACADNKDVEGTRLGVSERFHLDITTGATRMALVAHVKKSHLTKHDSTYHLTTRGSTVLQDHDDVLLEYSLSPHEWLLHCISTGKIKRNYVFDEGVL